LFWRDGEKVVVAALYYVEETGGWIRQLAVAKDYQLLYLFNGPGENLSE